MIKKICFLLVVILSQKSYAQQQPDTVVMASNFLLQTATGTLYASLTTPSTKPAAPLVIIVAGSGPTDRNGNSLAGVFSNSYKILADSLLQHGIATLRYDKRGIAKSASAMIKESDLRFDDYVKDLNLFIDSVRKLNRFSSIIIAGHSEGALIGLLSAIQKKVDKYISLAGTGFPIQATLKKQLANQPDSIKKIMYAYLDTLSKGKLLSYVPKQYHSLFRPSVQPYMINWMQYYPTIVG